MNCDNWLVAAFTNLLGGGGGGGGGVGVIAYTMECNNNFILKRYC